MDPDIKTDLFPKIKRGIYDPVSFNQFKSTLKIIFLLKGNFTYFTLSRLILFTLRKF
jgi:hypothetical protein